MRRNHSSALLAICTGLLLASGGAAIADEVLVGNLVPVANGGSIASQPRTIKLSATKPDGITKEPAYLHTPMYGTASFGDAKNNTFIIAVDAAVGGGDPRIYIAANRDGNLALAPIPLSAKRVVNTRTAATTSPAAAAPLTGAAVIPIPYDVSGETRLVPGAVSLSLSGDTLSINRAYDRVGKLTIGANTYKIELVDQAVDGRFNMFHHNPGTPAKVSLIVYRQGEGAAGLPPKVIDTAKSFRLGGGSYQIVAIDNRGTSVALKSIAGETASNIKPADLKVGGPVIPFSADLLDGGSVDFPADYKGKIVLLDFWAVWCPPCREEVPNTVAVYEQFHSKGFDILGVSLDKADGLQGLINFTHEHGMDWPEIFDGGYWKADIAVLYGIQAIPSSFLVDGNTGRILAMGDDLRGQGLNKAVEEALANRKH